MFERALSEQPVARAGPRAPRAPRALVGGGLALGEHLRAGRRWEEGGGARFEEGPGPAHPSASKGGAHSHSVRRRGTPAHSRARCHIVRRFTCSASMPIFGLYTFILTYLVFLGERGIVGGKSEVQF